MAFTINETPVHWDGVSPPARMPPWQEVVWIGIPGYSRRLWFISKTGMSWQQRQLWHSLRRMRDMTLLCG